MSVNQSYKKRVIAPSSDEESEDDKPLAKRVKLESPTKTAPQQTEVQPIIARIASTSRSESSQEDEKSLPALNSGARLATSQIGDSATKRARSRTSSLSAAEDDGAPLAVTTSKKLAVAEKPKPSRLPSKRARVKDEDSDDEPLVKRNAKSHEREVKTSSKPPAKRKTATAKAREVPKEEEDVDMADIRSSKAKTNGRASASAKKKGKKEEGEDVVKEEEEEVYKWWEAETDGTKKWTTLEHNGVLFPPPYQPHGIKMKYDGKPVTLAPEAEEVATFFAEMLDTDHVQKETFAKNFFSDFQDVLKKYPPAGKVKITDFSKCDFGPIYDWATVQKEAKRNRTKDEKKKAKEEKDEFEKTYKFCLVDGRKEKVGNFRVEPPGLFRGRGDHPKTGRLKRRVQPEQITINIGKDAKIPEPPEGHQWKEVKHDDNVTWLATWNENVNNSVKYVFLAAGSAFKGQADKKKFDKARALKDHIDKIRRDYTADLKSKVMLERQRATAIYLIDNFALRAGNEKDLGEEADTVGCCSLRFEHVTLSPPNNVHLDFLGKDSVRFQKDLNVSDLVFKNLKLFKKNKEASDSLFDRISTSMLNKHLNGLMEGLTAKVFRTFNASMTFQSELDKMEEGLSMADKVLHYNRSNRIVAELCNHQRDVGKNHGAAVERLKDKVRALKYQRKKLRQSLFTLDPTLKKKKAYAKYTEEESDIDDEWIVQHEESLVEKAREKAVKKFEKENEKLEADGEEVQKPAVLDERLAELKEEEDKLLEERKTGIVEPKRGQTEEKIIEAIKKMDDRIGAQRVQVLDREEGKTLSLTTSRLNYLDPRITFAWCKKHDVPVSKLFSKTIREKFPWSDVEADWRF
ncbi:hypothetical protein BT69DRAFT_243853 [Atractiella rhizophila]|nr:hypothetical protein BT69DRAFT_243853 [Atractiella rhizophila]